VAGVEKRPRLEHEPQTKFDLAPRAETVDSRAVPTRKASLSALVVSLIDPFPVPKTMPFIVFGGKLKLPKFGKLRVSMFRR
jgi:hypothetical protein